MAVPGPPPSQDFGNYSQNTNFDSKYHLDQQYPPVYSGPDEMQSQPSPPQPASSHHQAPPPQYEPQPQPQQQPQQQQFQYIDRQQHQYPDASFQGFDTSTGGDSASLAFSSDANSPISKFSRSVGIRYQHFLDAVTPHWAARWTFSLVILIIFMARIIFAQGCPKIDPAFLSGGEFDPDDFDNSDNGPMLPTKANDEFRPFIRRLPEFKFWLSATKATLISLFLTLFEVFDLPVFWPILLLYFILLFVSTMRQQIKHMIKYGYVPWDKGKKKYGKQSQEPSSLFSPSV